MNNNLKYIKHISTSVLMVSVFVLSIFMTSCEFDLPDADSIPDATAPSADFGSTIGDDYLIYKFANFSVSATDYVWDFGDGSTATSKDAQHTYAAAPTDEEGGTPYKVTLTASDKLGISSTISQEILVFKPEVPDAILPEIYEAGFEDNSLPDGTGDGRDSWRCSFGSVMQITSSPVYAGSQAAKFPSAGDRTAYQELVVSSNTGYILTYYYTMKTSGTGSITVSVLSGSITDLDQAPSQTIASFSGSNQEEANTYVKVDLPFNTGDNSLIAILIGNEGVECRIDEFSIAVAEK